MVTIKDLLIQFRLKIDSLDLELLIAHELKKSREFILAHPETVVKKKQEANIRKLISRRLKDEPTAYLLGHKEFYGLDFKVTKDTLIPRPETELLVEKTLENISSIKSDTINVIDVGTGTGNIIISLAKNTKDGKINYFGLDISKEALKVAKHNTKKHNQNKIKFINGNLLTPLFQNSKFKIQNSSIIILANLPYLSKEIYSATAPNVKNFEPKSALLSPKAGLGHYEKLLKQIKILTDYCSLLTVHCFLEFSPEQKKDLANMIKKILPSAKIEFKKDLAGNWRVCIIALS